METLEYTNAMTFTQAWTRILGQVEVFQATMKNSGVTAIKGSCAITSNQSPSCDVDKLRGFAGDGHVSLESLPYGHCPVRILCSRADGKMNTEIAGIEGGQTVSMKQALGQILENVSSYILATMQSYVEDITLRFDFDDENMNDIKMHGKDGGLYFWESPDEICTFRQLNAWLREEANEVRNHLTNLFAGIVRTRINGINHDYPGLDLSACIQDRNIGIDFGIEFSFFCNGERVNPDDMKDDDLEKIAPGLAEILREIRTACGCTRETIEIDKTGDYHIRSPAVAVSSESDMNGMMPS